MPTWYSVFWIESNYTYMPSVHVYSGNNHDIFTFKKKSYTYMPSVQVYGGNNHDIFTFCSFGVK